MVRSLHDTLGWYEGCGVAVVSLDEDRMYEAGGSRTKGAALQRETADGSHNSEGSSGGDKAAAAAARREAEEEAWADDRRLVKEGREMLPVEAARLLEARLNHLKLGDLAGRLPTKHFDSPFQHAAMMDGDSDLADLDPSEGDDAFNDGGQGGAGSLRDDQKAVTGVSVVTVAIRDAFLTTMALCLGHYRTFLQTPTVLRDHCATSHGGTAGGGGGRGGEAAAAPVDLSAILEGVGVNEWFDFPGFVGSFGKKDQAFAKAFSETQMFSSLVQQTVEESDSDVRILFFDEYCEVPPTHPPTHPS